MLEQLRAATNALHIEVEGLVGAEKMQDGTFSIADYSGYLLASYHFHSAVENVFRPHAASIPLSDERIKTPAIKQDLVKVGVDPAPLSATTANSSFASALGYLYVSEGSMLGAQIIYRSLLKIPRISELDAFQFLTLYNKRTGVLWSSLVELLEKTGSDADVQKVVVDSAVEAFELFRKVYREQLKECA